MCCSFTTGIVCDDAILDRKWSCCGERMRGTVEDMLKIEGCTKTIEALTVNWKLRLPSRSEIDTDEVTNIEELQCLICRENRKRYMTLPCRHITCCANCCSKFEDNINLSCIVCQEKVKRYEVVFF
jgi:hypothetical protein